MKVAVLFHIFIQCMFSGITASNKKIMVNKCDKGIFYYFFFVKEKEN